jgi:hypothetical protein
VGDTSMHTKAFGAAHARWAEGPRFNAGQLGGIDGLGCGGESSQRGQPGYDQRSPETTRSLRCQRSEERRRRGSVDTHVLQCCS